MSTLNAGDRISGTSGTGDALNVTLQNTNGSAVGASTAAVAQVNTYLFGATPNAATDTVVVNVGSTTSTITTGAGKDTAAAALAAAINNAVGSAIAVADGTDTVTVTAPVAGVGLPSITFGAATKANEVPATTFTKANTTASGSALTFGNLSGIEIVNVTNSSSSAATIDGNSTPGALQLNSLASVGAVSFTNVARTMSIGISGDSSGTTRGAVTGTYNVATPAGTLNVTGGVKAGLATVAAADAAMTSVTVSSSGGAQTSTAGQVNTTAGLTLTGAGIATLNINAATSLSFGSASGSVITSSSLTKIVASGAATAVTLNGSGAAVPNNVTSIDATGLTAGGISAILGTGITSFKGGAGVDTITTAATTATGAVIDGGAGSADILNLAATNDVTTTAKAAQYVNFEILRNTKTSAVDMSLFPSYTAVQSNGAGGGFTNLTASQAAAVTNRVDQSAITYSLSNATGSSDVLSVILSNGTSGTGPVTKADLAGATVTGFETMNVTSSSGSVSSISSLSFASGGAADLTALNITGSKPITVATANIAKAVTIDASANTYAGATATDYSLTISGDVVKASTITGTAKQDSLTTTAAVTGTTGDYVVYNALAGDDLVSTTVGALNNTSAGNASLKLNGGDGSDTLTFSDAAATVTLTDNCFQFVTGFEVVNVVANGNNAISLTSGGFFDSNFKTSGVTLNLGAAANAAANTVNLATFTGKLNIALDVTAATTNAQGVTAGSGDDVITVLMSKTTSGATVISGGAGNDAINVTIGGTTSTTSPIINGGLGQDTITLTGSVAAATIARMVIAVGEGTSTVAAPDAVAGASIGITAGTKFGTTFDFDGTAVAASNATSTASSIANVNYAITSGLMTFTGTGATTLSAAQKAAIAQAAITTANNTVVFTDGSDSYVFHNGAAAANAGDSLVKLVGVTALGAGIATGNAAAVDGYVFIA